MKSFSRLFAVVVLISIPLVSIAPASVIVFPGYDLFETAPGTQFTGIPFTGVPLVSYDFGGMIGVQPVGSTDTIVQRLSGSSIPLPPGTDAPIPIELVALHLQSVMPIFGPNFAYVTLQSEHGGPPSTGQMTISYATPNGGQFDSFFDVFFDVRVGALNGPILNSLHLQLTSTGVPWDRTPTGSVVIDGVNHKLNGTDQSADFWPLLPFQESEPNAVHVVGPPHLPEPASIVVWTLLGATLLGCRWWRYRRAA